MKVWFYSIKGETQIKEIGGIFKILICDYFSDFFNMVFQIKKENLRFKKSFFLFFTIFALKLKDYND